MIEPISGNGVSLWEVPRLWPDSTIIVVAAGPSADEYDISQFQDEARIIVVNDAYKLCPNADLLYGCDWWWWQDRKMAPEFLGMRAGLIWNGETGQCFTGWPDSKELSKVYQIASTGMEGLETEDRRAIKTGQNSGYQAINMAVHLGASRIILLGFDMKAEGEKIHFWGNYTNRHNPQSSNFKDWKKNFKTLVKPLNDLGIEIINCTPNSALKCFPMMELERAL